MDLNDVWQGNRRFILAVGCGAVLVLVAKTVISATWDVDRAKGTAQSLMAKLGRTESPSSAEVTRLKERNAAIEKRLGELVTRIQFKTAPEYVLPANGASPDLVFNGVRARVHEELVQFAAQRNIHVDESLGMPQFTPPGREAIQRCLSALDVVEQVVTAAILGEARRVDEIEMLDARRGRRTDRNDKAGNFVEGLQVKFRIQGSAAALGEVVEILTRGEDRFLAIEDLKLEADDKKNPGLLSLRLTVSALTIAGETEGEARS